MKQTAARCDRSTSQTDSRHHRSTHQEAKRGKIKTESGAKTTKQPEQTQSRFFFSPASATRRHHDDAQTSKPMLKSARRRLRTKGRDPARTPRGANSNAEGRFPMKGFCKTHAYDTVGINHCLMLGAVVGTVEHDLGANGWWVGTNLSNVRRWTKMATSLRVCFNACDPTRHQ